MEVGKLLPYFLLPHFPTFLLPYLISTVCVATPPLVDPTVTVTGPAPRTTHVTVFVSPGLSQPMPSAVRRRALGSGAPPPRPGNPPRPRPAPTPGAPVRDTVCVAA